MSLYQILYFSHKKSPKPVPQLMGGSVSSHSNSMTKSTMSAPGTGHFMREEMTGPGVALVKRLEIGGLTGLTVERDATFQVGNSLSTAITVSYAEWLNSAA